MQKALLDNLVKAVAEIDKAKQLQADAKAQLKKAMLPLLKELKESFDEDAKLATDIAKFKKTKQEQQAAEKNLADRLTTLKGKTDEVVKEARSANDVLSKFRKPNTANDPVLGELFKNIAPLGNGTWRTSLSVADS